MGIVWQSVSKCNMLLISLILTSFVYTSAVDDDFLCTYIDKVKDGIKHAESIIHTWEGNREEFQAEKSNMESVLDYLKTLGSCEPEDDDDLCTCINTLVEDIQDVEKQIAGAEHFVEKYKAEIEKRNDQLLFLNSLDLSMNC